MSLLTKLFGKSDTDYKAMIAQGAKVVDVRTRQEFAGGHVPQSENIPLQDLEKKLAKMKSWNKPIVLCCASGMRSGRAVSMMKSKGFEQVYNGGSWKNLVG